MIDVGAGPPIVLVPGIQGRWEWMAPAVEALAREARVVTGSLCGEPGSDCPFHPAEGIDNYVRQIDGWLDRRAVDRVAICGVSFGGLVAVRYAACRPERVTAVVLVSTPPATWQPVLRERWYLRAPWLLAPFFLFRAPLVMLPEIRRAHSSSKASAAFAARHLVRIARAPTSPHRMAARGRLISSVDWVADCRRVSAPTLVVTGEPDLDHVVAVAGTSTYTAWIDGAHHVVLPNTGHIGLVTRPDLFARVVVDFVRGRPPAAPPCAAYERS